MGRTKTNSIQENSEANSRQKVSAAAGARIRLLSKAALLSVSYAALGVLAYATAGHAQTAGATQLAQSGSQLPEIQITAPDVKRRARSGRSPRPDRSAQRRRSQTARRPEPQGEPKAAFAESQDARTGTVGIYANSTSVATKTNTALVNIPQSLSVITKDFIREQAPLGLTDVTRYVPGVAVHQGEGNRDELVIRGVDSSANFFVNGFRDDVQYFRDLYNAQSVEVLKGPAAFSTARSRKPTAPASMTRAYRRVPGTTGVSHSMPGRRSMKTWRCASTPSTRAPTPSAISGRSSATASTRP
jgi:outer membrane receptor protein involved in Fe transport